MNLSKFSKFVRKKLFVVASSCVVVASRKILQTQHRNFAVFCKIRQTRAKLQILTQSRFLDFWFPFEWAISRLIIFRLKRVIPKWLSLSLSLWLISRKNSKWVDVNGNRASPLVCLQIKFEGPVLPHWLRLKILLNYYHYKSCRWI